MLPTYQSKDRVIVTKWCNTIKENDIVVCLDPRTKRPLLKRIKDIDHEKYFVIGDNVRESTDSRQFGWIKRKDIIGKVVYHLRS